MTGIHTRWFPMIPFPAARHLQHDLSLLCPLNAWKTSVVVRTRTSGKIPAAVRAGPLAMPHQHSLCDQREKKRNHYSAKIGGEECRKN
ncbi:hypothetical protein PoB_000245400 [Plakobranchus ocellatus]|uniref:Uncharacterized protein n=1 Tax=Plakobranchus ocellatus TaxID=259542 RepID=A0AAV3Y151_9GAST|nr:hypothetical protein PoB_000245400 [Plakobranchus ocellatus]